MRDKLFIMRDMDRELVKKVRVLLIEGNAGYAIVTKRALQIMTFAYEVVIASSAEQALQVLFAEDEDVVPDLILLDLSVAQRQGLRLLELLKNNSSVKKILILIFFSSGFKQDILTNHELNPNAYIVKSVEIENIESSIQIIEHFWFESRLRLKQNL